MNQEQENEIKRLGLIELTPCKEEEIYDKKDRLILHRYFDGTTEEWKYDDRNNVIWHKYPNGTTTEWKYNDNDKIIWHKTPDEIYYIGNKGYRKAEPLDKEESK